MHTNGLRRPDATLGHMTTDEAQAAFRRHAERTDARIMAGDLDVAHPSQMGYGMVLEARGNVYGDAGRVPAATVAKRRAKNKAARQARAKARR